MPYSLFNGRLGIRAASGDWDATLFGNNLGDEGYCIQMFDQPLGSFIGAQDAVANTMVQRCVLGAPRTWNVSGTLGNANITTSLGPKLAA